MMEKARRFDVVVVGGGPAGIAAAVSAARNGSHTLLIEREFCLGGMATLALVPAFGPYSNGVQDLIGGIGREVLERMKEDGYKSPFFDHKPDRIEGIDWHPVHPEMLKRVLDEMVEESGCEVLFGAAVTAVKTVELCETDTRLQEKDITDSKPSSLRAIHSICVSCKGVPEVWIEADRFIDCTGDGEVSALAGAEWEYGDEKKRVQAGTLCFQVAGVNIDRFMEYANEVHENGNLKVAVSRALADGRFPEGEVNIGGIAFQADGIAGLNFGHVYNLEPLDPWKMSQAHIEARKRIPEMVRFLQEYVPGMERCVLISSGLQMGVRESRRICGEYTLTKEDYFARADFEDAIAYYSYPVDIHPTQPDEWTEAENRFRTLRYQPGECYGIPYRTLLPVGLSNLAVAGRCISAERPVMASIRIMSACMATGQAAGTAAAMASQLSKKQKNRTVQFREIDTKQLRQKLSKQGVYIKGIKP